MLIASFVLASVATLGLLAVFVMGAVVGADSEETAAAVGGAFLLFCFLPSVVGLGLGVSAMEKNVATPTSVWVASIWNGLLLGVFLLMSILGNLME